MNGHFSIAPIGAAPQRSGGTADSGRMREDEIKHLLLMNIGYDAGGNILSMKQKGLLMNSSAVIDSLTYFYYANSNRLQKITDGSAVTALIWRKCSGGSLVTERERGLRPVLI